jgi:heparin binding hemagglutinin HbhA
MTQPKTNRIPAPLYAAAGAGELALQQLRKLPTVVSDLGTKVVADLGGKAVVTGFELRQKATETLKTANLTAAGLREKAVPTDLDLDKLREAATRNAAAVLSAAEAAQERALAGAQAAQVRALAAYAELVARGERVVGAGVLEAADTVNADIEATEADTTPAAPAAVPTPAAPAAAAPAEVPTPAEVAEVVEAQPAAVKRTRAKATTAKATATKATPSAKLPKTTKRTRPAAE